MPIVSVVIATYRRPALIARAAETALAQTMADLEVIVVTEHNDAETALALSAIPDPRLRVLVNPVKRGPAAARDFGAAEARGRWIAFLDDDDEWDPTKLEKQLAAVPDERTICMTLSRITMPQGEVTYPTMPYDGVQPVDEWLFGRRTWLKGGEAMVQTSSLLVPRSLFDEVHFGNARHEEWELVIRAVKQLGYQLLTVKMPLVTYHPGNYYPWRPSAEWIDSVRDLVSARAYAGFCLTVATQGLRQERGRALATFFFKALRNGRPTPKQLFAFVMIALVPESARHRVRATLARRR